MQIRIGLENDPTVAGSVNKVYIGTETRDLYGMAREEDCPAWSVSTYVNERQLANQLSQLTQKSVQKTKKFPLNSDNYKKLSEELESQKEEAKKMLPELKRRMFQEEKQKQKQKEFWRKQEGEGYVDIEGGGSYNGGSNIATGSAPSMTGAGYTSGVHTKGKADTRGSTMAATQPRSLQGDMKVQDIILEIEETKRRKKKKKVLTWIYDGV